MADCLTALHERPSVVRPEEPPRHTDLSRFPPSLFNHGTPTEGASWQADRPLDDTHQALGWGMFSSNHTGLAKPYGVPRPKERCSGSNRPGLADLVARRVNRDVSARTGATGPTDRAAWVPLRNQPLLRAGEF